MRKRKLKDDEPMPESTEEQADVLEQEVPLEAPSPDFVNPETAPDNSPVTADEPEQQPLFGKADEVINVLETERSSVRLLIGKAYETISKKKIEIADLEKRQANIDKAIEDLRKFGGELNPDSGPLFILPEGDESREEEKPSGSISEVPNEPERETDSTYGE